MEKRVPGVIGQKAGVDTAFYRAVHNEEKIVELLMRSDISVYVKLKRKGVGTVKVGKHRKNLERKSNANPCVDLRVVRNSSLYLTFLRGYHSPLPICKCISVLASSPAGRRAAPAMDSSPEV